MKAELKGKADIVIVGAGAAGLFAALTMAERNKDRTILVLSEQPLGGTCASLWSQGGIAAAVAHEDNAQSHMADTLKAGAGTTDARVAQTLTAEAPAYIKLLDRYGVRFAREEDGSFALSREACHARRRVLKAAAADGFGRELMRALADAVRNMPAIKFVDGVTAQRILRAGGDKNNAMACDTMGAITGVLCRDIAGRSIVFAAPAVLLATGGVGGLYAATTNPLGATGRGIAMAARAGAVLSDLEFVQFHPTALDIGEDPAPLATEALRGEGAYLLNSRGERFMLDYHEMAELAPRDVVSRGIFAQIQRGQKVYLDCRHFDTAKFPALIQAAGRAGLNPARDLIPVMPAVHYHMGGISTDLNGRTSVDGLWAAGECAATGLHGANRLASNSLMEAVIMGARAAMDMDAFVAKAPRLIHALPESLPEPEVLLAQRDVLRQTMTDLVGVIRDDAGLKAAIRGITAIANAAQGRDLQLADMALVAKMIAVCALRRTESRGGHCRADFPQARRLQQKRSYITMKEAEFLATDTIRVPASLLTA